MSFGFYSRTRYCFWLRRVSFLAAMAFLACLSAFGSGIGGAACVPTGGVAGSGMSGRGVTAHGMTARGILVGAALSESGLNEGTTPVVPTDSRPSELSACTGSGSLAGSADGKVFARAVSTVVLDAGHGGHDPGATKAWPWYPGGTLVEKDIVLDLVVQIKAILEARNFFDNVLLTRDSDTFVSLEDRARFARFVDPGADADALLVSVHVNAAQAPEASGFELLVKQADKRVVFLDSESPSWLMARYASYANSELNRRLHAANIGLARSLQASLAAALPEMRDRGVKERNLWVLNASAIPSVLVEVGFATNEGDARLLANDQWRREHLAQAIADGIIKWALR